MGGGRKKRHRAKGLGFRTAGKKEKKKKNKRLWKVKCSGG